MVGFAIARFLRTSGSRGARYRGGMGQGGYGGSYGGGSYGRQTGGYGGSAGEFARRETGSRGYSTGTGTSSSGIGGTSAGTASGTMAGSAGAATTGSPAGTAGVSGTGAGGSGLGAGIGNAGGIGAMQRNTGVVGTSAHEERSTGGLGGTAVPSSGSTASTVKPDTESKGTTPPRGTRP